MLLVWERGGWATPGGAVNVGESKVEALTREVKEEVGLEVDRDRPIQYLGGWSSGRARDNLSNDNFSAFAAHVTSDAFIVDNKEIFECAWFEWKPLLDEWIAQGRPGGRSVKTLDLGKPKADPASTAKDQGERNILSTNVLRGLEVYRDGRGFEVKTKDKKQAGSKAMKCTWGSLAE